MKKIVLLLVFALSVSTTKAWVNVLDQSAMVLASQNLTPAAQERVKEILKGGELKDHTHYLIRVRKGGAAQHTRGWNLLHLDSNLQPLRGDGEDALVAIEKSLEIVRARNSHSAEEVTTAFRVIINLMCDMHNFSYVRIEGVSHSQTAFTFTCYAGDIGSRKTTMKIRWANFWHSYTYWHGGFSGDLWAEDLELCLGSKFAEYSQGTLTDWTKHIGEKAAELYARINPEYVMTRRERNELEMLNYEMMARAGFRLAALFNELAK